MLKTRLTNCNKFYLIYFRRCFYFTVWENSDRPLKILLPTYLN